MKHDIIYDGFIKIDDADKETLRAALAAYRGAIEARGFMVEEAIDLKETDDRAADAVAAAKAALAAYLS